MTTLMTMMLGAPLGASAITLNFADGSLTPSNVPPTVACGGGGDFCGPANGAVEYNNVAGSGVDVSATADGPGDGWFVWHDLVPTNAGLGASRNIGNTGSDNIFAGEEVSLTFSEEVILFDWTALNHGNGLGGATYSLFVDTVEIISMAGLTEGALNVLNLVGTTFRFLNTSASDNITTNNRGLFYVSTAEFRPTRKVPEPATMAMLGLGLIGLGFARRSANRS